MEQGPINPFYKAFSEKTYQDKINSPSKSDIYYHRFHHPLIEEAKKHADTGMK